MRRVIILGFAVVLLLAFSVPAYGVNHTARDKIKNDPTVAAEGLTAQELDEILDAEKALADEEAKEAAADKVRKRIKEMYGEDPQLRENLRNDL